MLQQQASVWVTLLQAVSFSVNGQGVVAPVVVRPTGQWEGMDGPWPTFALKIGQPPQIIHVLPATGMSGIFVNLPPQNCQASQYTQYCSNHTQYGAWDPRAGTFEPHNSTTWWARGNFSLAGTGYHIFGRPTAALFGYDNVGLDTDAFGASGMANQSVAGIMGYDLGSFGISPNSVNFSSGANPSLTFFGTLQANTRIPSRTWSFTQGIYNENSSLLTFAPSLIFGGYDQARIVNSSTITIPMNEDIERALSVEVTHISINSENDSEVLVQSASKSFTALIDSSVTHMLLPWELCQIFERSLGLRWDNVSGLYPINQTEYERLKVSNRTVVMNIRGPKERTTIRLPLESLMLHAGMPLVANPTRFFALKRATENVTQYTLGRAFLQNTYITADYDKGVFNLSRVIHTSDSRPFALPAGLPPLHPFVRVNSGGIVAGISLSVVVLLIMTYLAFAWKKKKPPFSKKVKLDDLDTTLKAELSGDGLPRAEADSSFEKVEAPDTQRIGELSGDMVPVELPGVEARYELPAKP